MAYDEKLGDRIRDVLVVEPDLEERKMFGGLAFLLGGHMCVGIVGDELMVRVGPEGHEAALARPHARPMDFTGTPMKGLVYVASVGLRDKRKLAAWIEIGRSYVRTLPPKKPKPRNVAKALAKRGLGRRPKR
jgi:TfoX/Sxy family transcriptional regulator of competence genes